MTTEAQKQYYREWSERNREKRREYKREWQRNNRDKVNEYQRRYWARKLSMEVGEQNGKSD